LSRLGCQEHQCQSGTEKRREHQAAEQAEQQRLGVLLRQNQPQELQ
jgi:hypothetical protein